MYAINRYFEASTLEEAFRHKKECPGARWIAGGSDLLIQIREGKLAGAALVGIRNIPGLSGVELDDDENIHIGPLTTFAQLAADPVIRARIPMLGRAVDQAGGPQLRNVGTIGGNICNGITSADSAPSLFALDALLELSHIGPSGGIATVVKDIGGFYLGPGKVDLAPDQLLTDICIPKEKYDGFFGCYMKYAMRNAMDIATLGCAVYCRFSGDLSRVEDVRLAYGVANPTPCRCPEAEKTVAGMEAGEEAFRALGRLALGEINPRDSWRASRAFRLQLAEEMAFRCGMACLEEARQTGQAAGGDSRASVSREQALTRQTQGAGCLDKVGQPGQGQAESGAGLPWKDAGGMSDAGGKGNTGAGGPLYWLLRCTVNGQAVEIVIDSRESLADLLRNRLGLTSVKKGCDVGECGACTVLVDGKTIDSCIYLARWAEGKHVLTTEGLRGMDNALTPVQQAFIDEAAVQCGFCTPGLIMTATELVDSGRRYTREELRKLISGHICRCTGYQNILDAVEKVVGVEYP